MRRLIIIVAMVTIVAPALAGHGAGYDGGSWNYTRTWYLGNGGEFDLIANGTLGLNLDAYASTTHGANYFNSFCIETTETIYNNMRAFVSTAYTDGTQPGSHAWLGSTSDGDDLNSETAWLYTQFATGTLAGYDYTASSNRSVCAGALQRLFWNIEGEGGFLTLNDTFQGIQLTQNQVDLINGWRTAYTNSGWTGIGNVRVLQMYDANGVALRQDQLYLMIPVPAAALLGLIGVGLVGWAKRRLV